MLASIPAYDNLASGRERAPLPKREMLCCARPCICRRWWRNGITQSSRPFAIDYWPEVNAPCRWSLRLCVGFCIWFSVSSSLGSHSTPNLGLHSTVQDGIWKRPLGHIPYVSSLEAFIESRNQMYIILIHANYLRAVTSSQHRGAKAKDCRFCYCGGASCADPIFDPSSKTERGA